MVLAANVLAVFKQQVFSPLKDRLVLGTGFSVFAAADFVDDAAEVGHDVKRVEYNSGLGQFFLTALINGSHISITTASIPLRCLAFN